MVKISGSSVLAAMIAACGLASAADASGFIYKHSLDANGQFSRYDTSTNSWTNLTNYVSSTQMAVQGAKMWGLNAQTNRIELYDASNDSWSDVMAGPGNVGGHSNLERLSNGEFAYTRYGDNSVQYTVGGVWQSTFLNFSLDSIGAYDPNTERLIVGNFGSGHVKVLDASAGFTEIGDVDVQGVGESARGGAIMNGQYYSQWAGSNLLSFDVATLGNFVDHGGGTSFNFYDSLAGDPSTGLMYVCSLFGDSLKSVDVSNNFVTPLAGGPNNGNHSSIAFVPVPTPGAAALLGMGGLAACRRRRNV